MKHATANYSVSITVRFYVKLAILGFTNFRFYVKLAMLVCKPRFIEYSWNATNQSIMRDMNLNNLILKRNLIVTNVRSSSG